MKAKKLIIAISLGLLIGISAFIIWGYTPPKPMVTALDALESDELVNVVKDDGYYFIPKNHTATIGFIFYPGGRVDPRSYAPLARAIAEAGYLVVIVQMPLNLAVFGQNKAGKVIEEHPSIEKWIIGGHSLGGAMASTFVAGNPSKIDGLVFWASYPAQNISTLSIPILSIYGTLDGLTTLEDIEKSRSNLPASTQFVPIEGGNHGQFGYYGEQSGDQAATITRADQKTQIVNSTVNFLESFH
jgi:dienelactone hydrolase